MIKIPLKDGLQVAKINLGREEILKMQEEQIMGLLNRFWSEVYYKEEDGSIWVDEGGELVELPALSNDFWCLLEGGSVLMIDGFSPLKEQVLQSLKLD